MPTYEYACDCGKRFDIFQSISSTPFADCPKCGTQVRRSISNNIGGIIFKGPGFYVNDYKRTDKNQNKKKDLPKQPTKKDSSESKPAKMTPETSSS